MLRPGLTPRRCPRKFSGQPMKEPKFKTFWLVDGLKINSYEIMRKRVLSGAIAIEVTAESQKLAADEQYHMQYFRVSVTPTPPTSREWLLASENRLKPASTKYGIVSGRQRMG